MISTRARGWTRAACAAAVVWVWVWAGTDGHAGVTATGDVQPANPTTWDTSTDSFVGKTAPGFLRIDGGDRVQSRLAKVGYEAGVTGTVTVDGPQSKWGDMLGLNVGHGGEGALTLTNGGTVYSNYGYVGNRAGSTGTVVVDGANSYWDSREGLWVGYEGTGTLRITGGGGVHSLESYIGAQKNLLEETLGIILELREFAGHRRSGHIDPDAYPRRDRLRIQRSTGRAIGLNRRGYGRRRRDTIQHLLAPDGG